MYCLAKKLRTGFLLRLYPLHSILPVFAFDHMCVLVRTHLAQYCKIGAQDTARKYLIKLSLILYRFLFGAIHTTAQHSTY